MNLTNLMGMNSNRNLGKTARSKVVSTARLSSGKRINSASDDAAGLAISQKMIGQIRGLNQADRNIADGMSVVNTMDGGMEGITQILQRQRELTIQAMNDTNTPEDKALIQDEIDELTKEVTRMAETTQFNGISLLNKPTYIPDEEVQLNFDLKNIFGLDGALQLRTVDGNGEIKTLLSDEKITINVDGKELVVGEDFKYTRSRISTYPDGTASGYREYKYTDEDGEELLFYSYIDVYNNPNGEGQYITLYDILANDTSDKINVKTTYDFNTWQNSTNIGLDATGKLCNEITNGLYNDIGGVMDSFTPVPSIYDNSNGYSLSYGNKQITGGGSYATSYRQTVTLYDPRTEEEKTPPEPFLIQCGANTGQTMELTTYNCTAEKLGVSNLKTDPYESANKSLQDIDSAINKMSSNRAKAGAEFNRLEYAQNSVQISSENLESSKSRILDADMAKEAMELVKIGLLENVAISMLAQSNNQITENVQQLLQ